MNDFIISESEYYQEVHNYCFLLFRYEVNQSLTILCIPQNVVSHGSQNQRLKKEIQELIALCMLSIITYM